MSMTSQQQL